MRAVLRATALMAAVCAVSCASPPHALAAARSEYRWVLAHGGCDCGPLAYAAGSSLPSWLDPTETAVEYVRAKATSCASRQFVVAAFGDGTRDVAADMNLARARAAPFVRSLSVTKYRRLDTLLLAGPRIAHPSTLAIMCPTDTLPPPNSF